MEKITPLFDFAVVDSMRPDMCLHSRVAQNEVLNLHTLVDVIFDLIILDLSRTILVDLLEEFVNVVLYDCLRRQCQACQFSEAIDSGLY